MNFDKRFLIAVREPEGSSFARHINLQLTYSFQNNAQNPMHMNGNKGALYPAHGKSPKRKREAQLKSKLTLALSISLVLFLVCPSRILHG